MKKMDRECTHGLRTVLFDEMDDLRAGIVKPAHANAVAKIAGAIIDLANFERDNELALGKYSN